MPVYSQHAVEEADMVSFVKYHLFFSLFTWIVWINKMQKSHRPELRVLTRAKNSSVHTV